MSRPSTTANSSASIHPGEQVLLSGLRTRTEYNGKLGKVQEGPDERGHVLVKMNDTGTLMKCNTNRIERSASRTLKTSSSSGAAAKSNLIPSYMHEINTVDLPAVPVSHPGFARNPSGMCWIK
eukprot:TRINITY_DN13071_c1_g1_i1.p1 TRINITY_DN13071_c1_g1~~TRINITY_DN13071_c1_g1_i1.p1  ORF type:complete len:123 (-),score=10.79 TRINITY_DN13071_c1_g1_i1:58-426(-)